MKLKIKYIVFKFFFEDFYLSHEYPITEKLSLSQNIKITKFWRYFVFSDITATVFSLLWKRFNPHLRFYFTDMIDTCSHSGVLNPTVTSGHPCPCPWHTRLHGHTPGRDPVPVFALRGSVIKWKRNQGDSFLPKWVCNFA